MTVALFGTFDVANYGDALFPLLVRRRLVQHGSLRSDTPSDTPDGDEDFIAVSPLGGKPYRDALPSVGLDEFLASGRRVSAVLLGGGNILHASPLTAVYAGRGTPGSASYPALWLAAEAVARRDGAPLLWNAPGIPVALPALAGRHLRRVAEASAYVSVRDANSRKYLIETGLRPSMPIAAAPDPAFELSRLFDAEELTARFTDLARAQGRSPDERWVVLHASPRRPEDQPAALARHFDEIARLTDSSPLLLALGPCHGDGALLRETARLMETPPLLVDTPAGLADITACLARASSYVGASMHGAIASASFGVPCLLVPPGSDHKHRDLMDRLATPARLRPSWKNAVTWITAAGLAAAPGSEHVRRKQLEGVDAHWNAMDEILAAAIPEHAARESGANGSAPRLAITDLLPADLLLEQLETATRAGLPVVRAPVERVHGTASAR